MMHWSEQNNILTKYSKPSSDLTFRVQDYTEDNDEKLKDRLNLNDVYRQQPKRVECKVCFKDFSNSPCFETFGIKYFFCIHCKHLNGEYQDTDEFSNYVYSDSETSNYQVNYSSNYELRVENIYKPKVEHLLESLDLPPSKIRLLDFGCGAGHFVKAALDLGVECIGVETNLELTRIGKRYMNEDRVRYIPSLEDLTALIQEYKPNTVSLIGVLEHLTNMDTVLELFKKNGVRFIYASVPMFSLTSLLQPLNEGVFPRQLSGGHTHLFSNESFQLLMNRNGYRIRSKWWFGTDILDLQRLLIHSLTDRSKDLEIILASVFHSLVEGLQEVLDRKMLSSEIHALSELE
jgi:2-polyprenyl-3-methyl-5-hydroxy-6-metoxy-1,4-benzoquinol methylase